MDIWGEGICPVSLNTSSRTKLCVGVYDFDRENSLFAYNTYGSVDPAIILKDLCLTAYWFLDNSTLF